MEIQLSFTELRRKDVVNMVDGRRLGRIVDIVFNVKGQIIGLVTPGFRKLLFFKATDDIFVPWCDIKKIGDDVILVELRPQRVSPKEKCCPPPSQSDCCCDCGHCDECLSRYHHDGNRGQYANGSAGSAGVNTSGGGTGGYGGDEGMYYSSKASGSAYSAGARGTKQQNPKYYYTSGGMHD